MNIFARLAGARKSTEIAAVVPDLQEQIADLRGRLNEMAQHQRSRDYLALGEAERAALHPGARPPFGRGPTQQRIAAHQGGDAEQDSEGHTVIV